MAGTLGEESNKIHQDSDVDNSNMALHHTLGRGANQSAAGNHDHDEKYSERTHTHDDLSGSGHEHALNTLSDVTLNAPGTDHFLGYGADGQWTNEPIPKEAHSQIAATAPVPRGLGDLWVDTSSDLLTWDSAWIIPVLINGYTQHGGYTVRFRKLPGGMVFIEGMVRNASASVSPCFSLPAGYRPDVGEVYFPAVREGGFSVTVINSAGSVTPANGYPGNQWHALFCLFMGT